MSNNKRGRKPGSKNRFTQKEKEEIGGAVKPHLENVLKNINAMEPGRRLGVLLDFAPYFLTKGKVSDTEAELQAILYTQFLRHYERIGFYFNHLPIEKKADFIVKVLKLLTPKQISTLSPIIKKKLSKGMDK